MNLISTIRTRINGRVPPLINTPKPLSFARARPPPSLRRATNAPGAKRAPLPVVRPEATMINPPANLG
mgnify:CR=1 FL=1